MKTKIIYISGSEVFNMADVRNAFDTVRHELGLARDTILFGVPVDNDDALGGQFDAIQSNAAQNVMTGTVSVDTTSETSMNEPELVINDVTAPASDVIPEAEKVSDDVAPVIKKTKRTKKVVNSPMVDDAPANKPDDKAVIPILSVLAADDVAQNDNIPNAPVADMTDIADDDFDLSDKTADDVDILGDLKTDDIDPIVDFDVADIDNEIPTVAPQIATVIDTSDDDADGLEKLLKSVQSLNEDELPPHELSVVENNDDIDETDATLEKLATEFAENQDKIVNTTKSSARGGRIGKLKNILPFKKAKSSESSLMGDLFGWAGVAANDEEFGIPEFFPTAAKK